MWYVVLTAVNPKPEYIAQTGYPYTRSDVLYCGGSEIKAKRIYEQTQDELETKGGEYVYDHNMEFMNDYDVVFKKDYLYYTLQLYKK